MKRPDLLADPVDIKALPWRERLVARLSKRIAMYTHSRGWIR